MKCSEIFDKQEKWTEKFIKSAGKIANNFEALKMKVYSSFFQIIVTFLDIFCTFLNDIKNTDFIHHMNFDTKSVTQLWQIELDLNIEFWKNN